jgi:hypothetical protein
MIVPGSFCRAYFDAMRDFTPNRLVFLILVLCIFITAVSAESAGYYHYTQYHYGSSGHNPEHTESGCPACTQIETARNLLKSLVLIKLAAILAFFAGLASTLIKKMGFCCSFILSPIALKAKFNS